MWRPSFVRYTPTTGLGCGPLPGTRVTWPPLSAARRSDDSVHIAVARSDTSTTDPLPVRPRFEQRGGDAEGQRHGPVAIAHGTALGDRVVALGRGQDVCQSTAGEEGGGVVARLIGIGPAHAVAVTACVDQRRVALDHRVRVEAQPGQSPGPQVGEEHVGGLEQLVQHPQAVLLLQVQGERALAAVGESDREVDPSPVGADALRRQSAVRIALDALDAHDIGPPVGQHRPRHRNWGNDRGVDSRWPAHRGTGARRPRYRATGWWTDTHWGSGRRVGPRRPARRGLRRALPGAAVAAPSARSSPPPEHWPAGSPPAGSGAGDVVVLQLPNWMEAGVAFFAATYPARSWCRSCTSTGRRRWVTSWRPPNRRSSSPPTASGTPTTSPCTPSSSAPSRHTVAGCGRTGDRAPAPGDRTRHDLRPRTGHARVRGRPRRTRAHRVHVGHHARPEGGRALAPDDRVRDPPARADERPAAARRGSPARPSATSSACSARSSAVAPPGPVHLIDVWNPGEVLRIMLEEQVGMVGGATFFLTSLLDHPDFSDEHRGYMPYAGPRRLAGSGGGHRAAHEARHHGLPLLRQHRAPVHHRIERRRARGQALRYRWPTRSPGVELRLDDDGQIVSRGPDLFVGYTDPELTAHVSTTTAGTTPATSACSTTTATSPSPTA